MSNVSELDRYNFVLGVCLLLILTDELFHVSPPLGQLTSRNSVNAFHIYSDFSTQTLFKYRRVMHSLGCRPNARGKST